MADVPPPPFNPADVPPAGGGAPSSGPPPYTPQPGPPPMGANAGWSGPPLAEYGQRVVAYLIDLATGFVPIIAVLIVSRIIGIVIGVLGLLILLLGYLAVLAYQVWNIGYLQGTTGQSLGKRAQGISLVKEETMQPVGFGMSVVRYILAGAIGSVTCGIYGLLDILWPLWDPKRQRLTDKILKMAVIKSNAGALDVNSFNPFAPKT